LVLEGKHLSYGELDERAGQLARHLVGLGVGPDVLVGICLDRSFEMVIALLGVLKAGGAYVPVDPAYPAERKLYMTTDSRCAVFLTQASLLDELKSITGEVENFLLLDDDWPKIVRGASRSRSAPPRPRPGNLAYVIYT